MSRVERGNRWACERYFPLVLCIIFYQERFLTTLSHSSGQAQICPSKGKCTQKEITHCLSCFFFQLWQKRCNLQVIKWCYWLNILLSMKQNLLVVKQVTSQHCFCSNRVMAKSTFLVYLSAEGLNEHLEIFRNIFSPFSDWLALLIQILLWMAACSWDNY